MREVVAIGSAVLVIVTPSAHIDDFSVEQRRNLSQDTVRPESWHPKSPAWLEAQHAETTRQRRPARPASRHFAYRQARNRRVFGFRPRAQPAVPCERPFSRATPNRG